MCRLEDHGGSIELQSEENTGTTSTVTIPIVTEAPVEPADEGSDAEAHLDRR